MTWHTSPIAPAPVNSSVIFPVGPPGVPFLGEDGGHGANAAAAAEAYSDTRVRETPVGEGREIRGLCTREEENVEELRSAVNEGW